MSKIEIAFAISLILLVVIGMPLAILSGSDTRSELRTKFPPNVLYHFKGDDVKYAVQAYSTRGIHAINTRTGKEVIISNTSILEKVE